MAHLYRGPKDGTVYEVSGPDAYETPDFRAIKGFGPFEPHVLDFRRPRPAPHGDRQPLA